MRTAQPMERMTWARGVRCGRRWRGGLAAGLVVLLAAAPAASQSMLERTPNQDGVWVPASGVLQFNFLHRFTAGGPPLRRVSNKPTFLLGAGLPGGGMLAVRYATASRLVNSHPNEWEAFVRWRALSSADGAPLDLALNVGYNEAANSADGELTVAREVGPVRLAGVARYFSDRFGLGDAGGAVGVGTLVSLGRHVAVGGDAVWLPDAPAATDEVAWGAALQVAIPTTPHTLSLQVVNTNTATMQGASKPTGETRYGFEFTIPVTLSRYFGGGGDERTPEAPPASPGDTVVVTMTTTLRFDPDPVRVRAGQTVVWRNTSPVIHTVTADPARAARPGNVRLPDGAAAFHSGDMRPGAVYRRTFTVPGEYAYICVPHELAGMVGRIIVEP